MRFRKYISGLFTALICIIVLLSCSGRPVTKDTVKDPLPGVWMRIGDYANGTLIKVVYSGESYAGYLIAPKGKLASHFQSNDCKWTNIAPSGTNRWTCGDMFFWINYKGVMQEISNSGYLPCIIVLSGANTLYLFEQPATNADFSEPPSPQKWIRVPGL